LSPPDLPPTTTSLQSGNTPLHRAAAYGHAAAVQLLVDVGADVNCISDDGSSALCRAARWGHADVVALLLSLGAATGTADNNGRTALDWAERKGWADVAALLRKAAAEGRIGGEGEEEEEEQAAAASTSTPAGNHHHSHQHAAAAAAAAGVGHHAARAAREAGEAGADAELLALASGAGSEAGGDAQSGVHAGGGDDAAGSLYAGAAGVPLPMRVEGWMAKQGHIFRNWKNRWFVLEGRCVFYFAKEGAAKARGVIRMVDGTDVIVEERYPKPYCFTIVTPSKRYVLQAADEDEMAEWLEAVQNNLECMRFEDQPEGGQQVQEGLGDDD